MENKHMDSNKIEFYKELTCLIKHLLRLDSVKEKYRTSSTAFTRVRILTFAVIVLFLLNLNKRALQDELDEYFKLFNGLAIACRTVTKSGFSQARAKIKAEIFVYLNEVTSAYFYKKGEPYRWHGFLLTAIDGSMATLPKNEEIGQYFGVWHPNAGGECAKARVSQLYDVLNRITIHAIIAPKERGERSLAEEHLEYCREHPAPYLHLLDRGYASHNLFAYMIKFGMNFCARISVSSWVKVCKFVESGKKEQLVLITVPHSAKKECLAQGLPTTIRLRLLRVELPSGEIEVLATTLFDQTRFPQEIFAALYHQRWGVEEDYKVLKLRTEFENWTGTSVHAVLQDFHAKVLSKNIAFIIAHHAQPVVAEQTKGRQYVYQVNMTNLIAKMKGVIVLLLTQSDIDPLLEGLWEQMLKTIEPIRPGRSEPRNKKVKPPRFAVSYKGTQ
jgi:hypothetical protein